MWKCPKCHEQHEDSFAFCWNCGTSKEGVQDPWFAQSKEGTTVMRHKPDEKLLSLPCAKCGSTEIVPVASIYDQGQESDGILRTFVYSNPEAWVFKGSVYGRIHAKVCGECGYTELFTANARELYKAYSNPGTQYRDAPQD